PRRTAAVGPGCRRLTEPPRRSFDLRRILALAIPAEALRNRPWGAAPGSRTRTGRPLPQAAVALVHRQSARRRNSRRATGTPKGKTRQPEPPSLRGGGEARNRTHSSAQVALVRRTHPSSPGSYALSSFFSSFRKRQSVPSAMIFLGLDRIMPASWRRRE